MELYILDSLLRRTGVVIDRFESMIWTERYSSWGDFELKVFSTPDMRRLLPAGTRLAMSESYRIMIVEFVENAIDDENREILKLTGRSLEAILEDRTARNTFANLATTPKWLLTGTPGDIARQIFNDICRDNANFPDDEIPFLQPGTLFPPGTIEEPDSVITIELGLGTVYAAVKELCDVYDLGFRLLRNFDESELYFDIYSGNDRTTLQTALAPVVFAPNLDNLTNISEIVSISNYKNVAYVFHPYAVQIVTVDGVPVEVSGFDRRVLTVDGSSVTTPDLTYAYTTNQVTAIDSAMTIATLEAEDAALQAFKERKWLSTQERAVVHWYATNSSSTVTAPNKAFLVSALALYDADVAIKIVTLNDALQQLGRDELAKNRSISAFDGELPMNSPYPYEIAYALGDLVEMRNVDGVTNQMRVMEQIFVSDASGERGYPTLTIDRFITPGSWFAWDYNQVWENAEGEWAELP